ncbi:MAG: hypothetical protein ABFS86_13460 [Planctomycetota bacterium]
MNAAILEADEKIRSLLERYEAATTILELLLGPKWMLLPIDGETRSSLIKNLRSELRSVRAELSAGLRSLAAGLSTLSKSIHTNRSKIGQIVDVRGVRRLLKLLGEGARGASRRSSIDEMAGEAMGIIKSLLPCLSVRTDGTGLPMITAMLPSGTVTEARTVLREAWARYREAGRAASERRSRLDDWGVSFGREDSAAPSPSALLNLRPIEIEPALDTSFSGDPGPSMYIPPPPGARYEETWVDKVFTGFDTGIPSWLLDWDLPRSPFADPESDPDLSFQIFWERETVKIGVLPALGGALDVVEKADKAWVDWVVKPILFSVHYSLRRLDTIKDPGFAAKHGLTEHEADLVRAFEAARDAPTWQRLLADPLLIAGLGKIGVKGVGKLRKLTTAGARRQVTVQGAEGRAVKGLFGKEWPRPSGPESRALKAQFLRAARDPLFRARANAWAKLTGRGPIDWKAFGRELRGAEFREFASKVEAASGGWAGRTASGERWLFGAQQGGRSATGHELFHALQDVKTGFLTRDPGWFEVVRAEYSAHLFGGPRVGVPLVWVPTAAGVGVAGYGGYRLVEGR